MKAAKDAVKSARKSHKQSKSVFEAVYKLFNESDERNVTTDSGQKCSNCKNSQPFCLNGKPLTESQKNVEDLRVQATGSSWDSQYLGKTGKIVKTRRNGNENLVFILWDFSQETKHYTFFSRKKKPKFVNFCPDFCDN